ncbi:hypothetical protein PVK06_022056 [Gossypium arboreum]|uniref:Uncharacterized protein n=1 Tax=Gossypium arboreum TaxID=29729 RepID=A0ABR0P7C5_GOSAR|nr:hypothetical protein PVK06_022056 [Gossypium arboreum]
MKFGSRLIRTARGPEVVDVRLLEESCGARMGTEVELESDNGVLVEAIRAVCAVDSNLTELRLVSQMLSRSWWSVYQPLGSVLRILAEDNSSFVVGAN